jgi:hypothetical protein
VPLRDEDLEASRQETREIDYTKLISDLGQIPPGTEHASAYHNFIFGILQALFYPGLRNPQKEAEIHDGRKRIDISFNNGAKNGFFSDLRSNYKVYCPLVFFECKNYAGDPTNPELDQLAGRFSNKRGMFGAIVCRTVQDKPKMLKRCKDSLHDHRGWIFVLDDDDIITLLKLRSQQNARGMADFLNNRMRDLVM